MIRDIIRQHHGTSTINYFYAQALEQDENVNIEDFKYPGPKPTSKEAALYNAGGQRRGGGALPA